MRITFHLNFCGIGCIFNSECFQFVLLVINENFCALQVCTLVLQFAGTVQVHFFLFYLEDERIRSCGVDYCIYIKLFFRFGGIRYCERICNNSFNSIRLRNWGNTFLLLSEQQSRKKNCYDGKCFYLIRHCMFYASTPRFGVCANIKLFMVAVSSRLAKPLGEAGQLAYPE